MMRSRYKRKSWLVRWVGSPIVILVLLSILYLVIKAVEVFVTYPASWTMGWSAWLTLAVFVLALFWYAMFVLSAKELKWFGRLRRPVNATVLCLVVTGIAWRHSVSQEALLGLAAASLVIGYLAEFWVEGL